MAKLPSSSPTGDCLNYTWTENNGSYSLVLTSLTLTQRPTNTHTVSYTIRGAVTNASSSIVTGSVLRSGSVTLRSTDTYPYTYNIGTTISVPKQTSAKYYQLTVKLTYTGIGVGLESGTSLTINALQSYTITYNANGGTGAPASQTKYYGTDIYLSTTKPTRENYSFRLWNTSSSGGGTSYQPGSRYQLNQGLSLYALWAPYVSFDKNTDAIVTNMPSATTWRSGGTAIVYIPTNVPTRNNYVFNCWNTSSAGSGTSYDPGDMYSGTTAMNLYAIWNPRISYDAQGGSSAPSAATKTYGEAYTIPSSVPVRSGYTFSGWNTASDGSGTPYASGGTIAASMNTAITLYAQWVKDPIPPTISSLTVVRSNSSGVPDDMGTYCKVTAKWSIDTTNVTNNTATVTGKIKPEDSSATTITLSGDTSGTSGTVTALVPNCDTDKQYTITITVTDAVPNTTSRSNIMTRAFFIMDLKSGGNAMGIGVAAPSSGLEVGWKTQFDDDVTLLEDLSVTGDVTVTGNLSAPELAVSSYTSNVISAGSGWTLVSQSVYVMHKLVMVSVSVKPTSAITAGSSSSYVCSVASGYRPAAALGYGCDYGFGYVTSSGSVYLYPMRDIGTSDTVHIGLIYLKA